MTIFLETLIGYFTMKLYDIMRFLGHSILYFIVVCSLFMKRNAKRDHLNLYLFRSIPFLDS